MLRDPEPLRRRATPAARTPCTGLLSCTASSQERVCAREPGPNSMAPHRPRGNDMDNIAVVRAVEAAWEADKLDELDQYFAADFDNASGIPNLPKGLEGAKMAHGMSRQFLDDRTVAIEDIFGGGDKVCA